MNSLDIVILGIIGLTIASGLIKGLIKQVLSIGGVVIGYLVAVKLYEPVAAYFSGSEESSGTRIITFLIIFILCIVLAALSTKIAEKFIEFAGITWANRIAGAGIGLLKGLLIVLVIVGVLSTFLPSDTETLKKSVTLPYLTKVVKIANDVLPDNLQIRYKGSGKGSAK
jgi:membrane protein required for colicin V production